MKNDFFIMAVGSALLVLSTKHKLQSYDDLVFSILLAQLVASKKIEKESRQDWYDLYVSVLDDFWLRASRSRRDIRVDADITKTPLQWLASLDAIEVLAERQVFAEALAHAASITNTESLMNVMHKHMEKRSEAESRPLPPLLKKVQMLVIMAPTPTAFDSVYLEFTTLQETSFTPWARFQTADIEGPVCIRTARANLSETLYQPVRDAIALKVRDRLAGNVVHLDMENHDPSAASALSANDTPPVE